MGSEIFQFRFKIYDENHTYTAYTKDFLQALNKQNSFYGNRIRYENCINKRVTAHSYVRAFSTLYIHQEDVL